MKNVMIGCAVVFAIAGAALREAEAQQKEIAVDLGGVTLELEFIRNASFEMGDNSSTSEFEKPQHGVNITKPFYMGKYPVTQEQWQAIMGGNPSKFRAAKNPVECVSWDDCQVFLARLNAKTGEQRGKFALPTEAQWEFASRAGSNADYERLNLAASLKDYAWFDLNSGRTTHPVGQKKPNAWDLYDMHGNVWQWCADWYGSRYYGQGPQNDPPGPAEGAARVLRGGGWNDNAWACRSAARGVRDPGFRLDDLGLRVLRTIAGK